MEAMTKKYRSKKERGFGISPTKCPQPSERSNDSKELHV
jgi:hypothetical protein